MMGLGNVSFLDAGTGCDDEAVGRESCVSTVFPLANPDYYR